MMCLCTIIIGSALFNSVFSNTIIFYSKVCYIYNERPCSSQNIYIYIYILVKKKKRYISLSYFVFSRCSIHMFLINYYNNWVISLSIPALLFSGIHVFHLFDNLKCMQGCSIRINGHKLCRLQM